MNSKKQLLFKYFKYLLDIIKGYTMVEESSRASQDVKALQSSILVLSEKIKYLVHNEKILSRNILVLNKKIAAKGDGGSGANSATSEQFRELQAEIKELKTKIKGLESTLEMMSRRYAKAEDLKEMKYIIDNINPLEYTTVEQVKKLIKDNK
jgi:predicted  nucleic acid-binding Zn-ribbon protein